MENNLSNIDSQLAILQNEETDLINALQASEIFIRLENTRRKIADLQAQFRQAAVPYMQQYYAETGSKTSRGAAGKITLVERDYIRVNNSEELPTEYWSNQPDMDKIKRDIKLFHKDIPGVLHEKRPQVNISWNNNEELANVES